MIKHKALQDSYFKHSNLAGFFSHLHQIFYTPAGNALIAIHINA